MRYFIAILTFVSNLIKKTLSSHQIKKKCIHTDWKNEKYSAYSACVNVIHVRVMQEMSCSALIRCRLWLAAAAVVMVALTTHPGHQADASWPPIVPSGGMAMYECCCLDNPACGGCFRCRQNVYTCYCDTCSCYWRPQGSTRAGTES